MTNKLSLSKYKTINCRSVNNSNGLFASFCVIFIVHVILMLITWDSSINSVRIGSTLGTTYRASMLLLCIYCGYIILTRKCFLWKGIHIICILWIFMCPFFYAMIGGKVAAYYVMPILWPLLFEATYVLCYCNEESAKKLRFIFIFISLFGCYLFLSTRMGILKQTNTIYFCFLTLPWLLYGQKKKRQVILLFLFTFLGFLSLKRSIMLSLVLCWGVTLFSFVNSRQGKLYVAVLSIPIFLAVAFMFNNLDNSLGGRLTERVTREETADGANRLALWEYTIGMIKASSPTELVFGHGQYGVMRDSYFEMSSHNDFLEVIYDFGLIVLCLYVFLWYYVLRKCYCLYKIRSPLFLPYSVSVSIFIVMSMVSHLVLYASYFVFLVMLWAAVEGMMATKKISKFRKK